MKLSQLIIVWEKLHVKDTGDVGFCDLEEALESAGVEVINDMPGCQPTKPIKVEGTSQGEPATNPAGTVQR